MTTLTQEQLKQTVREAVDEALRSRHGMLHRIVEDIIEDIGMGRAIHEAEGEDMVQREEVFESLECGE